MFSFKYRSNGVSIKNFQNSFGYICQASAKWNRIFSLPSLFIIFFKLITASVSMFTFIQSLLVLSNQYLSTVRWFMLGACTVDCIMMAIIFTAADIPVEEVSYTLCNILATSHLKFIISYLKFVQSSIILYTGF